MITKTIVTGIIAVLFLVFAFVFLMGKGDKLIAGYNTASEEERKTIDIKRLRIVMAVLMVVTAVFCTTPPLLGNDKIQYWWLPPSSLPLPLSVSS